MRSIAELVENPKYGNVYTDLAYFTINNTTQERTQYVDNLVYLLDKYKNLKDRLLVGTDWPMIELETVQPENEKLIGIGTYMTHMMKFLSDASKRLGYDAWQQFGIINQLRFLGLLEESGEEMKIKVAVLEDYKDRLKGMVGNKDNEWKTKSMAKISAEKIDMDTFTLLSALKGAPTIPLATDVRIDDELAILRF